MPTLNFDPRLRGPLHIIQSWGLPFMVGVLLTSLWAFILLVSTTQRQRLIEDSQRELGQLNNAVSQHVAAIFGKAETDLRTMDRWLQAHPRIDPGSDPQFVALVDELRRASNGLIELRLVSADGKSYAVPMAPGGAPADVSDRAWFKAFRADGERSLQVGEPTPTRVTNRLRIPLLWRLDAPVSGMSAAFAAIDLNRLDALHEQMRLKPNGSIVLMRADGVLLSRTPYDQGFLGRNLADSPGYRNEYGARLRGSFIAEGAADGTARLISYQRLDDYPVTVLVNRPIADVLDVYGSRRDLVFGGAAALTLLALIFTWVLFRSQRALRQAQQNLQRLEATDSLTGVMSRRAFLDAAGREFSRARRYGRPTAVLMFDLDHFKRVNDSYGHAVGDTVLRDCAAAWKTVLRRQDLLGRIGGEEFCAVMPETPPASALQAAERLRRAVTLLEFDGKGERFGVTVSVGLTMLSRGDEELTQAMERADRALYLAKERGRNRVESVDEPRLSVVGTGQSSA